MRRFVTLILTTAAMAVALPAVAQQDEPPAPNGGAASGGERITQVIVYGEDPCKASSSDEIVVCVRRAEKERYRIPPDLRDETPSPRTESWLSRARSIEYVGRSGSQSCSPSGAMGYTGCFARIAADAKAERKANGSPSWADLVAKERAKRLGTIDKDSDEIEARVKAEEAAAAHQQQQSGGGTGQK